MIRSISHSSILFGFLYLFVVTTTNALVTPSTTPQRFQRARLISGSTTTTTTSFRSPPVHTFMSEDNAETETTTSSSKTPPKTFYDDEVNPDSYAAPKAGISDSMRERLKREASRGLDSEQKQTNVILYISVAVALLVIAGGSGILY